MWKCAVTAESIFDIMAHAVPCGYKVKFCSFAILRPARGADSEPGEITFLQTQRGTPRTG